jgi:very-short-patch-repair endonuclease
MLDKPKHLTAFARANRKAGNPAEMALWNALKGMRSDGLAWRKQHLIAGYIVDLCCLRARVVVEIDGGSHELKMERDLKRDADLTEQGFSILHYDHREVLVNACGIAEYLEIQCRERARLLYGDDYARRRDTRTG